MQRINLSKYFGWQNKEVIRTSLLQKESGPTLVWLWRRFLSKQRTMIVINRFRGSHSVDNSCRLTGLTPNQTWGRINIRTYLKPECLPTRASGGGSECDSRISDVEACMVSSRSLSFGWAYEQLESVLLLQLQVWLQTY